MHRRGHTGLKLPGYMRPTESAMASAPRVENLTCWAAGWPPSPRLARPRADTGSPLPSVWRPMSISRVLGGVKYGAWEAEADEEEEEDGSVVVHGGGTPAAAGAAGERGVWGEGAGGRFTPAAQKAQGKAQVHLATHKLRRANHARKEMKQELFRLHHGAWLQAFLYIVIFKSSFI